MLRYRLDFECMSVATSYKMLLKINSTTTSPSRVSVIVVCTLYRVRRKLADLGFVYLLLRYCALCPILLGQVDIWQNRHISLVAMAETQRYKSTKDSPRVAA